eukprot:3403168-Rhodomonas_salina.2
MLRRLKPPLAVLRTCGLLGDERVPSSSSWAIASASETWDTQRALSELYWKTVDVLPWPFCEAQLFGSLDCGQIPTQE